MPLLKETADEAVYQDLCCLSEYRKSMSSDQTAFASHLPSYQTKSGYILIIRLLSDFLEKLPQSAPCFQFLSCKNENCFAVDFLSSQAEN